MLLAPDQQQQGSSSRSPSPAPHIRLPGETKLYSSPHQLDAPLPSAPRIQGAQARSRTPSPESHPLPQPPKFPAAPLRAGSPLGRNGRISGPRPLPNPFMKGSGSQQSLGNPSIPSRSGTGETSEPIDPEDGHPLLKPSRKALGKRRAIVDEDSESDSSPSPR